jgi:H+/gluconate symporter-like permease
LAALVAAAFAGAPLLAHWTQTFMGGAGSFLAQFFPIFLLGAVFGKLMDDSGSVQAISRFMTLHLGRDRAILAVVLAGAQITYGGVSLFVAYFVMAPMAHRLFQQANIPYRLIPATIALGASTFTMSALPGTPALQNAILMPFFGTTPFAAPGIGLIAAAIMLVFGLRWLGYREAQARRAGEGYGAAPDAASDEQRIRELATTSREFDPAEIPRGHRSEDLPFFAVAILPIVVVIVNFAMTMLVLPRLDAGFLGQAEWGSTSLAAVGGVWSVITALLSAIVVVVAINRRRLAA